jgi:hypothetical protein
LTIPLSGYNVQNIMKTTKNMLRKRFPLMVALGFFITCLPASASAGEDDRFIIADRGKGKSEDREQGSKKRATPSKGRSEAAPASRSNNRPRAVERRDNRPNRAPGVRKDRRRHPETRAEAERRRKEDERRRRR